MPCKCNLAPPGPKDCKPASVAKVHLAQTCRPLRQFFPPANAISSSDSPRVPPGGLITWGVTTQPCVVVLGTSRKGYSWVLRATQDQSKRCCALLAGKEAAKPGCWVQHQGQLPPLAATEFFLFLASFLPAFGTHHHKVARLSHFFKQEEAG